MAVNGQMLVSRAPQSGLENDHPENLHPKVVALYPGSFKPPHASHIHAVDHLLNHVGVSKVVIIVSNRCRPLPGTDLVVDAASAVILFEKLLRKSALPLERIELVVARHRAVSEVTNYVALAGKHSSLLVCVGEEDFQSDDDRFSDLYSLAARREVSVRVQVLPISPDNVHASQMRLSLSRLSAGRREFLKCLPAFLSFRDKVEFWEECKKRLRPIDEVVRAKISCSLEGGPVATDSLLYLVDPPAVDPVFESRGPGGEVRIIKYAGDTTSAGSFGDRMVQKPARRIAVEKRATRYLSAHLSRSIFPTRIDYFDREFRVLILVGRPAGATSVAASLSKGKFDVDIARRSGIVLAKIHGCRIPETGFWSDSPSDVGHWRTLIATLASRAMKGSETTGIDCVELQHLHSAARSARSQVMHLSFTPDVLWHQQDMVSFENLECAGNFGDPAYDVASMVSSYLAAGVEHGQQQDCLRAIEEFVCAYRSTSGSSDQSFRNRVAIYTACHLQAAAVRVERPGWK